MNERIRELYIKTLNEECSNPALVDIEKFAELIVRECANIALNHPAKLPSNAWEGVDVPSDTSKRIKRHFGVEE